MSTYTCTLFSSLTLFYSFCASKGRFCMIKWVASAIHVSLKERARQAGVLLVSEIPGGAWIISHLSYLLFRILRPRDKDAAAKRKSFFITFFRQRLWTAWEFCVPRRADFVSTSWMRRHTRDLARRQKSFNGGGPRKIKFADAAFWRLWDIRATYRSKTLCYGKLQTA